MIDSLKYENETMNAIVRTKNQEIVTLKGQMKKQGTGESAGNEKLPAK